jgi:hypothetical protein
MNNPENNRLVTSNLAEVCYLLENHYRLTGAELAMGDMGAEVMLFTLEGDNILISRRLFMGDTRVRISKMPAALETIRDFLWKLEEEAEL